MTFSKKWAELECSFQDQVANDNRELSKLPPIQSSYVHNFTPSSPVDYVLIAMEPSTGVPGKDHVSTSQIARNFSWSVEDFILHYCIREYLCRNGETYHLTDLAKGGMTTGSANIRRTHRYNRWYPVLQKELRLLNKPGRTRIIAIGNDVANFLKRQNKGKNLCECVESILHYSRTAAAHRDRQIECWRDDFPEFSRSVDRDAFDKSIRDVLNDADMDSYICHRPEGGGQYKLTESRKKLMFLYKNRFSELRDDPRIVLKLQG